MAVRGDTEPRLMPLPASISAVMQETVQMHTLRMPSAHLPHGRCDRLADRAIHLLAAAQRFEMKQRRPFNFSASEP